MASGVVSGQAVFVGRACPGDPAVPAGREVATTSGEWRASSRTTWSTRHCPTGTPGSTSSGTRPRPDRTPHPGPVSHGGAGLTAVRQALTSSGLGRALGPGPARLSASASTRRTATPEGTVAAGRTSVNLRVMARAGPASPRRAPGTTWRSPTMPEPMTAPARPGRADGASGSNRHRDRRWPLLPPSMPHDARPTSRWCEQPSRHRIDVAGPRPGSPSDVGIRPCVRCLPHVSRDSGLSRARLHGWSAGLLSLTAGPDRGHSCDSCRRTRTSWTEPPPAHRQFRSSRSEAGRLQPAGRSRWDRCPTTSSPCR